MRFKLHVSSFIRADRGATAIEYGLIAAFIAVAMIVAFTSLGGGINGLFGATGNKVTEQLSTATDVL